MALGEPLPACWAPDSVSVVPAVATASDASFTFTTYLSASLPAEVGTIPQTLQRQPMCSTTGMGSLEETPALSLFPSPSPDGRFIVRGATPGSRYEVFDPQGDRCAEGSLPADGRLDLAHLAHGCYVLRLHTGSRVRALVFIR